MEDFFYSSVEALESMLRGDETFTASFAGEESDFVRFNKSLVLQASSVAQRTVTIDLIEGSRHAVGELSLSGEPAEDRQRLTRLVQRLRDVRGQLAPDPHLIYSTDGRSTTGRNRRGLPEARHVADQVVEAGQGRDLVGIYAAGAIFAGFASSFGQRNWYENDSHNLDWSFHHDGDRAVKGSYAGFDWSDQEFARRAQQAGEELAALAQPARAIPPGRYPVYLTPTALYEILLLLGWGGFGLRAHRAKSTPLLRMVEEGVRLGANVAIKENFRDGVAPNFQESGFLRPDEVVLVEGGAYRDCLVSPRSAMEYGVPTNGASESESPTSVEVGAGDIPMSEALQTLGKGVYVSNLWYLNFSDRAACRTTGMTRFATFWVENGRIQQPLQVMRFDETLFRMFGDALIGLTRERELLLDPGTYSRRSTDSARLPGVLIDDFTFTL